MPRPHARILIAVCILHAIADHASTWLRARVPGAARAALAHAHLQCPAQMHLAQPRWHIVIARACIVVPPLHLARLFKALPLAVGLRTPCTFDLCALVAPLWQLAFEQLVNHDIALAPGL